MSAAGFPTASVETVYKLARDKLAREEAASRAVRSRRVPSYKKMQQRHHRGPAEFRRAAEMRESRQPRSMFRDGVALRELALGTRLSGVVQNLVRHGAYVDVGAVTDGLVHIRDMSVDFVHEPKDVVRSGDNVVVWVKYINAVTNVLGLSMVNPNLGFEGRMKVGEIEIGLRYDGFVERVTNYGAYVDIGAERLGFLHVAALWGRRPRETLNYLRIGQKICVNVDDVDEIRSHIKLRARGKGEHELRKDGPLGELADPSAVVEGVEGVVSRSNILRERVFARPGDEEVYEGVEEEEGENEEGEEDEEGEDGEIMDEMDAFDLEDMDLTRPSFTPEDEVAHMFDGNTEFIGFNPEEEDELDVVG